MFSRGAATVAAASRGAEASEEATAVERTTNNRRTGNDEPPPDASLEGEEKRDGDDRGGGGSGGESSSSSAAPSSGQDTDDNNGDSKVGAGVLLRTLKPGDAVHFPRKGDTCRVHYEGFLENGEKFDSSRARKQTFLFKLGSNQVIEGLDCAVSKMSVGQVAQITIPPMYAYGESGYPPVVPPRSTLVFDVELIDFASV